MADKKATRQGYGDGLAELGKKYDDLVVLEGDLGHATGTLTFRKAFPERHIEAGIAEQNMIGMAVGLSKRALCPLPPPSPCFPPDGLRDCPECRGLQPGQREDCGQPLRRYPPPPTEAATSASRISLLCGPCPI